jgi:hypothetical protein
LVSQAAADGLGQPEIGLAHREAYDVGGIDVRIVDLADLAEIAPTTWVPAGSAAWPQIRLASPGG